MLKVGLTGGIGCGKSTVTQLFENLDTPVIDADKVAHHLVETGKPALLEIAAAFGESILKPDGSLDRNKLRELVFSNPIEKTRLENILHPLVYAEMQQLINNLDNNYCIVSVPLLLETNMAHFVDRILIIDCPVEMQISRVQQRDHLNMTMIQRIIDSQVSRESRLAKADDVIDNSGNGSELAEQVKKLHNLYHSIGASLR